MVELMKAILRIPGVGEFESLERGHFSIGTRSRPSGLEIAFDIQDPVALGPERVELDLWNPDGTGSRFEGVIVSMDPNHVVDVMPRQFRVTVHTNHKPTPLPAVITSNELPEYEATVTLRRSAPSVEAFMEKVKWVLGDAKTARFDITVGEGREVDKNAKPGDRAGSDQRS